MLDWKAWHFQLITIFIIPIKTLQARSWTSAATDQPKGAKFVLHYFLCSNLKVDFDFEFRASFEKQLQVLPLVQFEGLPGADTDTGVDHRIGGTLYRTNKALCLFLCLFKTGLDQVAIMRDSLAMCQRLLENDKFNTIFSQKNIVVRKILKEYRTCLQLESHSNSKN